MCWEVKPASGVTPQSVDCDGDVVTIMDEDVTITSDWGSTIQASDVTGQTVTVSCRDDGAKKLVCLEFKAFTSLTYDPSFAVLVSGSGGTPPPQPCVTTSWSDYGSCSVLCGTGIKSRDRSYVSGDCTGEIYHEEIPCTIDCDCVVSEWSDWGTCSATCDTGIQTRTRTVVTPATPGGQCLDLLQESQDCNTQACTGGEPDVDCVSVLGDFGVCSTTCGGGEQTATYAITVAQSGNGAPCANTGTVTQPCNPQECEVLQQCKVSEWTEWECEAECGETTQSHSREVTEAGLTCDVPLTETKPCTMPSCGSQMLSTSVPVAPTVALVTISVAAVAGFALHTMVKRARLRGTKDIGLSAI
jgi:hypothetical protein